jgi:hypothetical protein
MRGLRLGFGIARGGAGASFSIAFTGLSTDGIGTYGQVGGHAAISYTITPDNGTETVKWSASSDPGAAATFGTGASPTTFAAADGFLVYLHVTDGGHTVTRSFTARKAPATGGVDLDLSFPEDSAITSTNLIVNWTTNSNTLTFVSVSPTLPTGLSVNSSGTMTGTPTTITADATYTLTMQDAYGRQVTDTFTLEIVVASQLTAVDMQAQEANGDVPVALTGDNGTYFWILTTTDPAVNPPSRAQVLAGQTHTGSAAPAAGSVVYAGSTVNVSLPAGLNGSYYLVLADSDSIVFDGTAQAIDSTAPTLSGVSTTAGDTAADLDWSTNTGSGTAYWIVTTSATPPSNAAIIAGTGAVGSNFGSAAVSGSGAQTQITATSLTNGTTYYFHLFHRDTFSNDSIVSTTSVVPASAWVPTDLGSKLLFWADPTDFTKMWTDDAKTTQVSATGQTVARIADAGGSGREMAVVTATGPEITVSGSDYYFTVAEGENLYTPTALPQTSTDEVHMNVKPDASNGILLGTGNVSVVVGLFSNGSSGTISEGSGTPGFTADGVTVSPSNRDGLYDAIVTGSWVTVGVHPISMLNANWDTLRMWNYVSGGGFSFSGLCGDFLITSALTTGERASLQAWLTARKP